MNKKAIGVMILTIFFLALIVNGAQTETEWQFGVSVNEITGGFNWFMLSPEVSPTPPMRFHEGIKAILGLDNGGEIVGERVYIRFNQIPQVKGFAVDDYEIIRTKVKFTRIEEDDEIITVDFIHKWHSKFLQVMYGNESFIIDKILNSDTTAMIIELDWFDEGKVYFKFPLEGAAKANDNIDKNISELKKQQK